MDQEDLPGKKKDLPGKKKDLPGKKKDLPGKKKDLPGKKKDLPEKKDDLPGKKEDLPGKNEDLPGKNEDLPGKKEDLPGKKDDLPGKKEDLPGKNEDLPGKKEDLPGKKEDLPGKKEDLPGKKEDLPRKKEDLPGKRENPNLKAAETQGKSVPLAGAPVGMQPTRTRAHNPRRVHSWATSPRLMSTPSIRSRSRSRSRSSLQTEAQKRCILKRTKSCFMIMFMVVGFFLGFMTAYFFQISRFDYSLEQDRIVLENRLRRAQEQIGRKTNESAELVAKQRVVSQVRVLCWVMTHHRNHKTKAQHVKDTWGNRCNTLLFMSTQNDDRLGAVMLTVKERQKGRTWVKTKTALEFLHAYYRDDADWFLKADDDTYVIVENLRLLLAEHDPEKAVYLGSQLQAEKKANYSTDEGGFVLSKEALDRLINGTLTNKNCSVDGKELVNDGMGKCLESVGVTFADTRDTFGRDRFVPTSLDQPEVTPPGDAAACCSDRAASFSYVTPRDMHYLEYLVYHLRPYGEGPEGEGKKKRKRCLRAR